MPRTPSSRIDAKTLAAWAPIVAILVGGAEARLAVSRLEEKVDRLVERVVQLERSGYFARKED